MFVFSMWYARIMNTIFLFCFQAYKIQNNLSTELVADWIASAENSAQHSYKNCLILITEISLRKVEKMYFAYDKNALENPVIRSEKSMWKICFKIKTKGHGYTYISIKNLF